MNYELLAREELDKAGVYVLIGSEPLTNAARAYIGKTEVIRERLKQQKTKESWVADRTLIVKERSLIFTKGAKFSSPSAAAVVIHGGSATGLTAWVPDEIGLSKH